MTGPQERHRNSANTRDEGYVRSVGDDVLGDDQTVIELQEWWHGRLAKRKLLVPSGTMSNAIAIRAQTERYEVITQRHSHIYVYEGGGYAALSGCSIALVPGEDGIMSPKDVESAIRKGDGTRSLPKRKYGMSRIHPTEEEVLVIR